MHIQVQVWKPYSHIVAFWSLFKVNDDGVVDIGNPQTMRCVICHSATISANLLAMCTWCKKSLITYNKANVISLMKKHVQIEHS